MKTEKQAKDRHWEFLLDSDLGFSNFHLVFDLVFAQPAMLPLEESNEQELRFFGKSAASESIQRITTDFEDFPLIVCVVVVVIGQEMSKPPLILA